MTTKNIQNLYALPVATPPRCPDGQLDGDREGWRCHVYEDDKSGNGEAEPLED